MSNKYNEEILVVDKTTGRNLYGMRVQMNCTQAEFGKKVGIDQSSMSAYERGERLPSKRTVRKVAAYFGLDPLQITGQRPMVWSAL